jgi:hypothetical protein
MREITKCGPRKKETKSLSSSRVVLFFIVILRLHGGGLVGIEQVSKDISMKGVDGMEEGKNGTRGEKREKKVKGEERRKDKKETQRA